MFLNNTTLNDSLVPAKGPCAPQEPSPNVTLTLITLSIIILVGLVGNFLVVAVVACISHMRTTTNYLLLNVAVSDIITLILTALHVGLQAESLSSKKPRTGVIMCKIVQPNTLSNVSLLATGLSLTILSIERYNAMVKPLKISRRLSKENVGYVIAGIWLVSMVMYLPTLVYLNIDPVTGICSPGKNKKNLYISLTFIVLFMTIAPFLVIAFSYLQIIYGLYFKNTICSNNAQGIPREDILAKRKLIKLLIAVTLAFFVAFVPYGVAMILRFNLNAKSNAQEIKNIRELTKVMAYLIPLHSSVNPFLYAFQSRNYKDGFLHIAKKMVFCRKYERNNNYRSSFRSGRYSTNTSVSTVL